MNKLFDVDRISENPRSNIVWRKEQIEYIINTYSKGESIKKISKDFKSKISQSNKANSKSDYYRQSHNRIYFTSNELLRSICIISSKSSAGNVTL